VLSRLVEDLRTLGLSEAGALPLQKEPVDVLELVNDVVRRMQSDAAGKPVEVTQSPPFLPTLVVELDPLRVREVLTKPAVERVPP
jgi:signal transduction histidine kinase